MEEISTKAKRAKQDEQVPQANRLGLYSHPLFPPSSHSLTLLRTASLCLNALQQNRCLAPGKSRGLLPGASQAYAVRLSAAIRFSFSGFSHLFAVACDCFLRCSSTDVFERGSDGL